jgi:hypothetical protein
VDCRAICGCLAKTGDESRVMLTVILYVTSENTDITRYSKLLGDSDELVVVREADIREGESIVALYNEIVDKSDRESDILLLSDCVETHGNILEEMRPCLYSGDRHAIVYGESIENNDELIEAAGRILPGYSRTVFSNPHCAMIKRKVINTLGFFDTTFNSLRFALKDYYYRINGYGFSSVVSYRALFSYSENKQEDMCNADCVADRELFASRYPYWEEMEERFILYGTDPCVEFLELYDTGKYPKKRILFDCIAMPSYHCGTSEYQTSVFEAFYRMYKDKYDIFLYTNREADEYHRLSEKYDNVLYRDSLSGKFHLGFAPNQLMSFEAQLTMNKHCLKIVQTMFDIIMVRVDEHFDMDVNTEVEFGVKLSDGIVFISNYTKNDFLACFANKRSIRDKKYKVVYLAADLSRQEEKDYDLPFDEYILIHGNPFKHKAINETAKAVSNSRHNFIVIGSEDNRFLYPNVYSYRSGHLEEDFLGYLYANCKAVVFPSLYEGFGLPIVMGLKNNKRVILYDNALNQELINHFDEFKSYFFRFEMFSEIIGIIESTDFSKEIADVEYNDTWDRAAAELEAFFCEILDIEMEPDVLRERWYNYKLIEAGQVNYESSTVNSLRKEIAGLNNELGDYRSVAALLVKVKRFFRKRLPGLFMLLKGRAGG